jgi:hypothetical protein
MPRRVLVERDGSTFDLVEVPAPNEHHLQEIMKAQPQLIPADDLGFDDDLLVVGRETSLASGFIDLLCIASTGDIVLIEFKTGPQNPDFRHALAQLIDYGSDLWRLSVEEFDRGVVQRYLSSGRAEESQRGHASLVDAVASSGWNLEEEQTESLFGRLGEVLATGDFTYVVAAQRFTTAMQASLEYLNATMRFSRFYLVEIVQMKGAELVAHAAQVVSAPPKRPSSSAGTPSGQADEAAFLAAIADERYRDAMRDLLASCTSLGIEVKWRSQGASLRIAVPDRRQPLSIGWVLPETSHWQGARFATFGVDPTSLAKTPSVEEIISRYVARLGALDGARAVPAKLEAFIFDPSTLPRVHQELAEVLGLLVQELNAQ